MERYTYQDGGKWRMRIGDTEYSGKAVDRLAAYEDTDLEPEDVVKIKQDVEDGYIKSTARRYGIDVSRLRELAQADREGRCVVLPCKTKETVYLITSPINISGIDFEPMSETEWENDQIFECEVSSMTIWKNGEWVQVRLHCNDEFVTHYITPEDFGKIVFLTCEEAEATLEGTKNG